MPYQNMTLEELARHLGIDLRELKRMAERGQLPGRLIGGQWRFNRAQLLDWLQREMHTLDQNHIRALERAMSDGRDQAVVGNALALEAVDMHLPARSKASVLRELIGLAERTGLVYDSHGLVKSLEDREAMRSTALADGIALPHPTRPLPYATAEPLLCLARVPGGIPFGAPDGRLTYLFVLICSHEERAHLSTLARLALMFTTTKLAELLHEVDDADEALQLVLNHEQLALGARR